MKIVDDQRRPAPRLRPHPVSLRPSRAPPPLGREKEQRLASGARPGTPVQFCGPDGIGKSALLRHHALTTPGPDEGVVFLSARRRSLDDLGPGLFDAFWECDERYVPSPVQLRSYLGERAALIVLDDVDLDRDDLALLLDIAPDSTWLLASRERTLWSGGRAAPLTGLSPEAGSALIERVLGRALGPGERTAAEHLARALDGHPQRLIEAAAIVEDAHASLEQLARSPADVQTRPYALTDAQLRLLAVIAAADGAALGTDHVAAIAGAGDAARTLADLERHGWVKSQSPRYRLTRPLPNGAPEPPVHSLLALLTARVAAGRPIGDDAEAIEGALRQGVSHRHWDAAVDLARAAERPLATAGLLGSWERVLWLGEGAARNAGRAGDAAWFVHQLGSREMCIGGAGDAERLLRQALAERERIGDGEGAELTRHNLDQLLGGGPPPGTNGHPPWWPRTGPMLAALAALLVVGGLLLLRGDDDSETDGSQTPSPATQQPVQSAPSPVQSAPPQQARGPNGTQPGGPGGMSGQTPAAPPPTIVIGTPAEGAVYPVGATVIADYKCTPVAPARRIVACQGLVDVGRPIDTTQGPHTFIVNAQDDAGGKATQEVAYVAKGRMPGGGSPQPRDPGKTGGPLLPGKQGSGAGQGGAPSCVPPEVLFEGACIPGPR